MSRLVWVLAWIVVAVWSLFAWAAYGLIDLFGSLAVRHADAVTGHPETVEWLSWTLSWLRSLGLATIVTIWGLVAAVILGVAWLFGRVMAPRPAARDPRIVDLAPDQYVVEPSPRRDRASTGGIVRPIEGPR